MNGKKIYAATVIGAGPAGISMIGRLLSARINKILWIDPAFEGGKMKDYLKVPANTRTKFFLKFMSECPIYEEFLKEKNQNLNPLEIFKECNPEIPPDLDKAYDMCKKLTENISIKYNDQTTILKGKVDMLILKDVSGEKLWHVCASNNENYFSNMIFLATGSKPKKLQNFNKKEIPLDVLVNNDSEKLAKYVHENDIIGVIGSSHSSILALKHLENLPYAPKKIHCFYRNPLKYAIYTDHGLINDNTGLKGQAAVWAREYLEAGKSKIINMHWMKDENTEKEIYDKYLGECTKIAPTIGFERNILPEIFQENNGNLNLISNISYNHDNLHITQGNLKETLHNIWGIGIAFPLLKKDLSGEMAFDVGIYKFGNHAKMIVEQICGKPKF